MSSRAGAETALVDLDDVQHNSRDGLHMASLAGSWIIVASGFGGMRDHDGRLSFAPRLPQLLTRISFGMCFRDRRLRIEVTNELARYSLTHGQPLQVSHHGDAVELTTERPVERAIPAIVAGASPRQPYGRTPQRRTSVA